MTNRTKISAIVAMDEARVIGTNNDLPWDIPEDRKHFAALTSGHTVLMGRKTYESLPPRFRPLPNRSNVVATRNPDSLAGESDIEVITDARAYVLSVIHGDIEIPSGELWIVGGGEIYAQTLPYTHEIELTLVKGHHDGDAFYPEFEAEFDLVEEHPKDGYAHRRYIRKELV